MIPMSFQTLRAPAQFLFGGRLIAPLRLAVLFLVLNTLVRLGLLVLSAEMASPGVWLRSLVTGFVFDAGVAIFVMAPFSLLIIAWPRSHPRALRLVSAALMIPAAILFAFTAFAEFTFWLEFTSRFNFIAVDYLVYSREVIGNIRESYNMPMLFAALAVASLIIWLAAMRLIQTGLARSPARRPNRLALALIWLLAPVAAYASLDVRMKSISDNAVVNELAGNGYFDILHAFWQNEIDYARYYRTIPMQRAREIVAQQTAAARTAPASDNHGAIANAEVRRPNVVLVSIESFSASFMQTFGNKAGLTPHLDALARESLLFTKVYATGTRTVRGLEALSLSIPPTPGNSVVKRPYNDGLFTLASTFNARGYESLYLYGGYSYFDNMQAFFGGNGYQVIDRLALGRTEIHHENIWGVADEDLFTLALREIERRHDQGKPVFAHIMTTSNHRPFTYPEGRIDIPSHSGRDGGVKYTDWAAGQFIAAAKKRPWFANTIFVFVADHTHNGRGKQELPVENYHIPLLIYGPGLIEPGRIDKIASQIDIGPTVLGLLGIPPQPAFFGADIRRAGPEQQRAFMSNYQTVGYFKDGLMVELRPKRQVRVVDTATGARVPVNGRAAALVEEAIAFYQVAGHSFSADSLRNRAAKNRSPVMAQPYPNQ